VGGLLAVAVDVVGVVAVAVDVVVRRGVGDQTATGTCAADVDWAPAGADDRTPDVAATEGGRTAEGAGDVAGADGEAGAGLDTAGRGGRAEDDEPESFTSAAAPAPTRTSRSRRATRTASRRTRSCSQKQGCTFCGVSDT
jgi:hypothetical protein